MAKTVVIAPVKLRRLKKEKSSIGFGERRSVSAKAAKRTAEATRRQTTAGDPQPQLDPWTSARISVIRAGEDSAAPGTAVAAISV